MSLRRAASPASVGEARRQVRAFALEHGAEGAALARIELAVSEAVTNVVVHGYPVADAGPIHVEADVEDGELELVVADEGRGFSGDPAPGLGLGLGLVRAGALAFEVRDRPGGGVELWASFGLNGG
jgi:anti-sigma regulatory factor (Ser/Thr protein kinase)